MMVMLPCHVGTSTPQLVAPCSQSPGQKSTREKGYPTDDGIKKTGQEMGEQ